MLEAESTWGKRYTMHEKLDFHKFAQGKSYGANEEKIKGKAGKYCICIPVYFNTGL